MTQIHEAIISQYLNIDASSSFLTCKVPSSVTLQAFTLLVMALISTWLEVVGKVRVILLNSDCLCGKGLTTLQAWLKSRWVARTEAGIWRVKVITMDMERATDLSAWLVSTG